MQRHVMFCLPGSCHQPTGGTKVVFEYANRLAARGHRVTLVLPAINLIDDDLAHKVYRRGLHWAGRHLGGPRRWFPVAANVELLFVRDLDESRLPDADVVVATFWKTAEWVARYSAAKGKKFYMIQHYETWAGPAARVDASWRAPMTRIVPAGWLVETGKELGVDAVRIPNGLDPREFGVDIAPEDRDACSAMMLFSTLGFKASSLAIEALTDVRRSEPRLSVRVFGTGRRPNLPPGFTYVRQPSRAKLRAMYNASAVFVAPSKTEGWDLPATEAMLCGCALVATDIDGHREYAVDGVNAVLVPSGDAAAMAAAVEGLVDDRNLRLRLAAAGRQTVKEFTWDRSTDLLERVMAVDSSRD